MKYQAHFRHTGAQTVKSEFFDTFQEAHACAAKNKAAIGAETVCIVEFHEDGEPGQVHQVTVMTGA